MKLDPLRNVPTSEATRSFSFTGSDGGRWVAWRRYDGTLYTTAEPVEPIDPVAGAVRGGNVSALLEMISAGRSLRGGDAGGWLPVHEACALGQEECLRVLLTVHPELIDTCNHKQQTPLLLAVERGHLACVESLLEWGADPNICNKDRESPLYKACEVESADMVELLLHHGAAVSGSCVQGWTALHEAASRDQAEVCQMLLRAGADVGAPNVYGMTPAFVAAQTGRLEALSLLLRNGADVNSPAGDGASALYEACKNGHKEVVRALLAMRADANKPTNSGLLPLHIAAKNGYDEIVTILIPVTDRAAIRRSGISPLHLAAEHNEDEILELLIQSGFDVNAPLAPEHSSKYQDRRTTALYFSVANGNVEAAAALLEAGADPNRDAFSPLLVAARQGHLEMVQLLVESGANVNAKMPNLATTFPATLLLCLKYLPMAKYLMDNGCDATSCFKCSYGSRQHPPLRTSFKDDLGQTSNDQGLQFCEMISNPSLCHWAGPIIDLLLDYVGDVKLCARLTEHLDSYDGWAGVKERAKNPRPLMQLCRLCVRKHTGIQRLGSINHLPLPERLLKFLSHEE